MIRLSNLHMNWKSSAAQKGVLVMRKPIEEEANDYDHETSDQVTTKPRRSTRTRTAPSDTTILS